MSGLKPTDEIAPGLLTDRTFLPFASDGVGSSYHCYAAGLNWSEPVGLLVYTDGSGEFGLKNPHKRYLLSGSEGLINVAKKHNMVLLTPLAPGSGCPDGDGTCWYMTSSGITPDRKAKWTADLIRYIQQHYPINRHRVAIGGYSSGAQWTTQYFGPKYASDLMTGGVAVAISFGGRPRVTPSFSSGFQQHVKFLWDTGEMDEAYNATKFGVLGGFNWYTENGFTTEINVIPELGHDRPGQFGTIMDDAIARHVQPRPSPPLETKSSASTNKTCWTSFLAVFALLWFAKAGTSSKSH